MSRIPNEGLKREEKEEPPSTRQSLNEQNPERGIETCRLRNARISNRSLNEQNPERGIETLLLIASASLCFLV